MARSGTDLKMAKLHKAKELHSAQATTELRILQRQDVADASSGEWGWHWMKSSCYLLQVDKITPQMKIWMTTSFRHSTHVDNVFQADDCDAFDSDVDEAPTAQTMFMANLSSVDPVYDEASPSYYSDIPI
ncbi:hypothetical protein Tco_0830944 [Tanacetum coccineum]